MTLPLFHILLWENNLKAFVEYLHINKKVKNNKSYIGRIVSPVNVTTIHTQRTYVRPSSHTALKTAQ